MLWNENEVFVFLILGRLVISTVVACSTRGSAQLTFQSPNHPLTRTHTEPSESESKPKVTASDTSKESEKSKDLPTLQQEDVQINSHQRYLIMQKLHRDEPTVLEIPPMPPGKVWFGLFAH